MRLAALRGGYFPIQLCNSININGNHASLLGGTRSPQLGFVFALPGNDGADLQVKTSHF